MLDACFLAFVALAASSLALPTQTSPPTATHTPANTAMAAPSMAPELVKADFQFSCAAGQTWGNITMTNVCGLGIIFQSYLTIAQGRYTIPAATINVVQGLATMTVNPKSGATFPIPGATVAIPYPSAQFAMQLYAQNASFANGMTLGFATPVPSKQPCPFLGLGLDGKGVNYRMLDDWRASCLPITSGPAPYPASATAMPLLGEQSANTTNDKWHFNPVKSINAMTLLVNQVSFPATPASMGVIGGWQTASSTPTTTVKPTGTGLLFASVAAGPTEMVFTNLASNIAFPLPPTPTQAWATGQLEVAPGSLSVVTFGSVVVSGCRPTATP